MRRVGDDVVDLDDPAIATTHVNERFVARVCAEPEREALASAPDRKLRLWSLFAAKEAAYKAIARGGPPLPFAHRRFVVADGLTSVGHGEVELSLCVTIDGACVHAVAWSGRAPPLARTGLLRSLETPGAAARRLLTSCLGDGIEVVRPPSPGSWDGYGPPAVERDGAPLDVMVSLSHDGRFASFAALIGIMALPAASDPSSKPP
ncbi:MAG: 4-phosphopantetheinyl transferase family protein [Myxococcaceae bacterium]|nr:4-phosphopantetheinyl transferase family protein [Myxococcaceae bacterium]